MLIDRYAPEDVFARVPELADQTDPVLVQLDRLLDDDQLYQRVRADLAQRYPLTPVHGRHSTPAEVILRLLVAKHLYNWSYAETVERVADSLVLRWFCRSYFRRVPNASTLVRWAQTIRPETLQALNGRVALLAQQVKATRARKLRIDSTCVQTPIHHPTDSGSLVDGVRVLSRLIRRARPLVQRQLAGLRDAFRCRLRTARRAAQRLFRLRRQPDRPGQPGTVTAKDEQRRAIYRALLATTAHTVRQATRVRQALDALPAAARAAPVTARLVAQFDRFLPLIHQVMTQARQRVLAGQPVASTEKVLSLFEPHTRVIPRQKGGAAVEFGRQVVLDEVEGGIVTGFHVLADGESECHQALPAIQHHRAIFGRPPWLVAGDRRLHTKGVEETAQSFGVTHVVIPRTGTLSAAQRARERQRSWRRRYRWRAGIEGRIHSLRRDYGLARCRSHGPAGLERDVGWGVLASNLHHVAAAQARRLPPITRRAA